VIVTLAALGVIMNKPKSLLVELLKLSPAERIQLAEDLWDSVAALPESVPGLTATQVAEIERRLIEHSCDPATAIPWEEVRARLWSRLTT
jgi:putative addiction module component (TIGR02574 family)